MEEFKTVRELYETCRYGNSLEKESIHEVGLEQIVIMVQLVLSNSMMEHFLKMLN